VNSFAAPVHWSPEMASRRRCGLTSDACIIDRRAFFVRAVLRIPVIDSDQAFEWGVWVSQSERDFRRLNRPWNVVRQHRLAPTSGRLSNELPGYEVSTVDLKAVLHHRRPGLRPLIELEPTDHPLAVDVRDGIPLDRAREMVGLASAG
jgi:hypothetical protein